MIVGEAGDSGRRLSCKLEPDEPAERRGDFATSDPDFRACEKLPGKDGIAACDRAIASGKFSGRALSYLYSDRGFLRMQTGAIDAALPISTRPPRSTPPISMPSGIGARSFAAKGQFERARADFTAGACAQSRQASKAQDRGGAECESTPARPKAEPPIPRSSPTRRGLAVSCRERRLCRLELPDRRHAGSPPMAVRLPHPPETMPDALARSPHRFLNSGLRFSMKAAMPSFWSSVANSE